MLKLGDALTLSDIAIATSLYRYFELEIERPPLPQVQRWYRTLQQHRAFCGNVMVPVENCADSWIIERVESKFHAHAPHAQVMYLKRLQP